MKPAKITLQFRARIRDVALFRFNSTNKKLAEEGGISELYCAQLISVELQKLKAAETQKLDVSRETFDAKMSNGGRV